MASVSKNSAGKAAKKSTINTTVTKRSVTPSKKAQSVTSKAKPATTAVSLNKVYKTAPTKSEILTALAAHADISKAQITAVLSGLADIINGCVKSKAIGEFTLPGLLKIKVVRKPATKARPGTNPFSGEPTIFKAKPAHNVVKIKALKKLKEMVV